MATQHRDGIIPRQGTFMIEGLDLPAPSKQTLDAKAGFMHRLFQIQDYIAIQFICRYRVPDAVPLTGHVSLETLATRVKTSPSVTERLIRHAITFGLFSEPLPDRIAHSELSSLLATDERFFALTELILEHHWPSATCAIDRLSTMEQSKRGKYCTQEWYQAIERDPGRSRAFGRAMEEFGLCRGYSVDELLDGYPWGSLGNCQVVDVGGSLGTVAVALAKRFPRLTIEVQDLHAVVTNAAVDGKLASRVSFRVHDFFEPQPHRKDLFLLRFILHNWPDDMVIRILRSLIPGMKDGSMVVVNDVVLQDLAGHKSPAKEWSNRSLDIMMMHLMDGKERTLMDWKALFRQADRRFQLRHYAKASLSGTGIMEFVWWQKTLAQHTL